MQTFLRRSSRVTTRRVPLPPATMPFPSADPVLIRPAGTRSPAMTSSPPSASHGSDTAPSLRESIALAREGVRLAESAALAAKLQYKAVKKAHRLAKKAAKRARKELKTLLARRKQEKRQPAKKRPAASGIRSVRLRPRLPKTAPAPPPQAPSDSPLASPADAPPPVSSGTSTAVAPVTSPPSTR